MFSFLVSRIESSMRELLQTDLALYPPSQWKDQGWDFVDSLDPQREWDGFSYVDMPDPLKGMEVRQAQGLGFRGWLCHAHVCGVREGCV